MENINVQKRDLAVKAKKLRQLGIVPCNVFGKSLPEAIAIQMDKTTARRLIRQKREGSKISLNIDGQVLLVQIKEKSVNTLNNEISHISFQALNANDKVNSIIHIFLANDEMFGGQLEKMLTEIPYAALPENMIDTITINTENLKTGDVLCVKDIPELMSDKIELQVNANEIVLRINEKKQSGPIISED